MLLAGDGRCDSPGSSAKYCTYSLMDLDTNTILHMETVDKREVSLQSPSMERTAVIRALKHLEDNGITAGELVTDASSAFQKMLGMYNHFRRRVTYFDTLATDHPTIHHSMDIWHKAKKLKKALTEVSMIFIYYDFTKFNFM